MDSETAPQDYLKLRRKLRGCLQNHLSEKLQWQVTKLLAGIGTLPAIAACPATGTTTTSIAIAITLTLQHSKTYNDK